MTIQWTHIGRTGQRKWKMRGEKKKGWGVRRGKAVWETGNKVQEEKKNERRVSIGVGKKKKRG